jgi:hypothetical protein
MDIYMKLEGKDYHFGEVLGNDLFVFYKENCVNRIE